MSRSLWKGPYFNFKSDLKLNKTYISRASVILPSHLNKTYEIHNGKKMIKVFVTLDKIGHKFGAYVRTKL